MPTKKSSTLAKQQQQHFKWYYAIILIGIIAIVGILVLRFSNAGTKPPYTADTFGCTNNNGIPNVQLGTPSVANAVHSGGCVKYLQMMLNGYNGPEFKGNNPGKQLVVDGQFGPLTENEVRSYQQNKGLSADGIVGPQTWNSLNQTCNNNLSCYSSSMVPTVNADSYGCNNINGVPTVQIGGTNTINQSTGSCVSLAQSLLNGYFNTIMPGRRMALAVDGVFGPLTTDTTKAYQAANGLSVDGIIGPQTWGSLINNCYTLLQCFK